MTRFQRIIVLLAGVLIALRVFVPVTECSRMYGSGHNPTGSHYTTVWVIPRLYQLSNTRWEQGRGWVPVNACHLEGAPVLVYYDDLDGNEIGGPETSRILGAVTMLHVLGIVVLAGTVFVLLPRHSR